MEMYISDQLYAPFALLFENSLRFPFNRRLGGPQSRSGRVGIKKNPCRFRELNPGRPANCIPSSFVFNSHHSSIRYRVYNWKLSKQKRQTSFYQAGQEMHVTSQLKSVIMACTSSLNLRFIAVVFHMIV